jgi:hypothetical protein
VLVIAGFAIGLFAAIPSLILTEKLMLGLLVAITVFGLLLGFGHRWDSASHIANTLPMLGLAFTGLGLLNAVASMGALTPDALASVFRELGYAIAPNIMAVFGMWWIKVVGWWAAGEEI